MYNKPRWDSIRLPISVDHELIKVEDLGMGQLLRPKSTGLPMQV
jgi:hypothetical protein